MASDSIHRKRLVANMQKLKSLLQGNKTMLIVIQDFPDPDALASAAALKELSMACENLSVSIACGGFVGRAENQALVRYLGLNLLKLEGLAFPNYDVLAMVDTQPGTGNNSFPRDILPSIVIDHHPMRALTRKVPFHDVRSRYGATSTLMYEYLMSARIEIPVPLATALLYGIRSDTNDLGRDATQTDIDAFLTLYPLSNKRMLGRIETEQVPRAYFRTLSAGLLNAQAQGRCVWSTLGTVENPDIIAEVAEVLLRDDGSDWALCCGQYEGHIYLSLRTSAPGANAGKAMRRIVGRMGSGGGHIFMAGGQIPIASLSEPEIRKLERIILRRFCKASGNSRETRQPLIPTT